MSRQTSDDLSMDDQERARGSFAATPVDARKRAEQVREKIVEMIREGYLKEGEKLPTEPQLSEMFGVGRSSVREAVQALIGLGVIEMRSGRGAFVRRLSLNDLVRMIDGAVRLEYGAALQVHEVRAMIEITAARLAANRRSEADLTAMKDAILRYRIMEHTNNTESLIDADLSFHWAIIKATHNDVLAQLFDSISALLREHRRQYGVANDPGTRSLVVPEHEGIYAAIASGNPAESAKRMQHHMRMIWRQIERLATKEGESAFADQSYLPMYDDEERTE